MLGLTGAPTRRRALPARSVAGTLGFAALSNRFFFDLGSASIIDAKSLGFHRKYQLALQAGQMHRAG